MRFKLAFLFGLMFASSATAQNYTIQAPPPSWGPVWTTPQQQPQSQQPQYQEPVAQAPQTPLRDDAIVVEMDTPQTNVPQMPPQTDSAPIANSQPQTVQNPPTQAPISRTYSSEAAAVNSPNRNQAPAASQIRTQSQMAQNSRGLSSAVSCAAALQIAALAAPGWSSEHGVAEATNLWLERVFTEADKASVSGDRVNALVKEEMEKQTNASINDPNIISRKAFDCATRRPA